MDDLIGNDRGNWEIVYTGFVLILLSFFIMVCSFSTMEDAKVARFVRSFVNTLVILPGGLKTEESNVIIPPSADIVDIKSDVAKILQNVKTYARALQIENEVSFSVTEKGLVMRISDNVLFDVGQAEITSKGALFLEKLASLLRKTNHDITIEGHADNLPIHTAAFPSNWELSTTRAVNVLRYFVDEEKLPGNQISAVGYGEFRPLFPNDTPEHRAKNRRVEIVLAHRGKTGDQ